MSLQRLLTPERKKSEPKPIGLRPIRTKEKNISYMPAERVLTMFKDTVHIIEYHDPKSFVEMRMKMKLYFSKNPHLIFISFHQTNVSPAQIIYLDTRRSIKIAETKEKFMQRMANVG